MTMTLLLVSWMSWTRPISTPAIFTRSPTLRSWTLLNRAMKCLPRRNSSMPPKHFQDDRRGQHGEGDKKAQAGFQSVLHTRCLSKAGLRPFEIGVQELLHQRIGVALDLVRRADGQDPALR